MRRIIRITLGVVFIVLGILGLFLPVLQGVLFLIIGVFLLASQIPLFARIFCWIQEKFPALERLVERMRERVHHEWHPPPCPPEKD
ncbi:MAG: DUF2892 domain-containing protein [Syntrophobacteraceae bacterium]|jgi:uncharacterized membrane protein YbaN (DUF454 family)|nr:DUF2892 domain-containing protein [Syntrophobacteraceae bacterium]